MLLKDVPRHILVWALVSIGLAVLPAHAQVTTPNNYTRATAYTYDALGRVKTEKVEPNVPSACVLTTYTYDDWGNQSGRIVSNCDTAVAGEAMVFAQRQSSQATAADVMPTVTLNDGRVLTLQSGQFVLSALNALNQPQNQIWDPRFGVPLKVTDANSLSVTAAYDALGRKTTEYQPDLTSTGWQYCVLASSGLDTSTNSGGCDTQASAPELAAGYVKSWRIGTGGGRIGPLTVEFFDRAGRTIRVATQGFDGDEQPAALKGAMRVQDTVYNVAGTKVLETQPYWFVTGSSTTAGSNDAGVTRYDVDAIGRPLAVYVADESAKNQANVVAFGSNSFQGYGQYGVRLAAVTSYAYAGGKTTITDDLAISRIEERNPIGLIVRTTDAYGAELVMQHDAFDNLRYTKDPLNNITWVNSTVRGLKAAITDPDSGYTTFTYNAIGELVSQRNATQKAKSPPTSTTYAYDLLGRKIQQVDDEYTSTFTYDHYVADSAACLIGKLCETQTSHGVRRRYWYDAYGKPYQERMDVSNGVSMAQQFNWNAANGRLSARVWPSGLGVNYTYSTYGYLTAITESKASTIKPLPSTPGGQAAANVSWPASKVLWRAIRADAWGHLEASASGAATDTGVVTDSATYSGLTGRVLSKTAGVSGTEALNQTYAWDSVGNLKTRIDNNGDGAGSGAVSETFQYDNIERLTGYSVTNAQIPGMTRTVSMAYNALGMLLKRSDVGYYTYASVVAGTGTVRPHALLSVTDGAGVATNYAYTAGGNLKSASSGKYSNITYNSFNQPSSDYGILGSASGTRYIWVYDESHARIKEVKTIASGTMAGTRNTWRMHPDNEGGLSFEYEENLPTTASAANPATKQSRHYVTANGQVVLVLVTEGALPALSDAAKAPGVIAAPVFRKVEYWHKDHLGSIISTTDHAGAVTARYSYDPFGQRRNTNGVADTSQVLSYDWSPAVSWGTGNGFTGHEELDDVGLVHMNGRLFDARLGVFMQPDRYVQRPFNLQSYNRYAYCGTNPLNCVDPSGYLTQNCTTNAEGNLSCTYSEGDGGSSYPPGYETDDEPGTPTTWEDTSEDGVTRITGTGHRQMPSYPVEVYTGSFSTPRLDAGSVNRMASGGASMAAVGRGVGILRTGVTVLEVGGAAAVCIFGGCEAGAVLAGAALVGGALYVGYNYYLKPLLASQLATSQSSLSTWPTINAGSASQADVKKDENGNRLYGPYFRHEQTQAEADAIVSTGQLWGGSPYKGGFSPAVMAYTQPMLNSNGEPASYSVMFYTTVRPETESRVGAAWYLGITPGVFEAPTGQAAIPIIGTRGPR